MENIKSKNVFLISCVSCVVLLLLMIYFGVNGVTSRGTYAASTCPSNAPHEIENGICCPNSSDKVSMSSSGTSYCVHASGTEIKATEEGDACVATTTNKECSSLGSSWKEIKTPVTNEEGDEIRECSAPISSCATKAEEKTSTSTESEDKCWECNAPSGIFKWSASTPTLSSCNSGWHERSDYKDQASCEGNNSSTTTSKCYQCNSPDYLYKWSASTPNSSLCSSGWHERSDYKDQASCEANTKHQCYMCGGSQGGTYRWGSVLVYGGVSNCSVNNSITDKAACEALANGETDNRCTGKDSAGRDFVSYVGMKISWTKKECNDMVKDGYCHVWDDTKNCCGVTEGSWCRGNGGTDPDPNPDPDPTPDPEPDPDTNVSENPGTGEITIFIMWVFGFAAVVYSFWYFKKIKES